MTFADSVKNFIAGGVGGTCVVISGHPLDTIKVRLQTMPKPEPGKPPIYSGFMDCVAKMYRNEGLLSYYKGVLAPLAGITPIFALSFFGNNFGRKIFAEDPKKPTAVEAFAAGGVAGVFSTVIMAPGERIKCLLQVQGAATEPPKYKGPIDVVKQLGVRSLFRGTAATFLRDIPASAVYFGVYQVICDTLKGDSEKMSIGATLFAGGTAGILNWIVAMPPDVLKSRLQTAPEGMYPNGVRSVFKELMAKEGFLSLYHGFTPVLIRAFPANAACFLGYEYAMKGLNYVWPTH